ERVLVELPDLRAHLLERLVPGGELAPADLAAAAAGAAVPAQGGGGVRAGRLRVLLLRRRRALRPDRVEDLVDDRLRRAVDALGQPDPAGQRGVRGVPGRLPGH